MAWQGVEELDRSDPASFYLERPEQVELADEVLMVEDTQLAVHSAVLSRSSKVFLQAFLTQREVRGSRKRSRAGSEGWNPFGPSSSLVEVAVFLRLLYRSQDVTTILEHGSVKPLLPALAHMANKFDVPWLLGSVQQHLGSLVDTGVRYGSGGPTLQDMVSYLRLAGPPLRLSDLRDSCFAAIVDHITTCSSSADRSGGFLDAAVLAGVERGMLASMFGALLCAVQASPKYVQEEVMANVPSNLRWEAWSQLTGGCDEYVWLAEGLGAVVAAGEALMSKVFEMAGQAWALELYVDTPSGSDTDEDRDDDQVELRLELLWLPRGQRDSGRPVGARAMLVNWMDTADTISTTMYRPEVFYAPRGGRSGSGGGGGDSEDDNTSGASSGGGGGAAAALDGGGVAGAVDGNGNFVRAALFKLGKASRALGEGYIYGFDLAGKLRIHFEMVY
ncbi:hypothetical protein N2152v2_010436 [Parachlorella kessleri]